MTKEEIKSSTTVIDVLSQYGTQVNRGRCKAICHTGDNFTAKVSDSLYYCFKCNKTMDIFDITMFFNNCNFSAAYEILGGTREPSKEEVEKANAMRRMATERKKSEYLKKCSVMRITCLISAYRGVMSEERPYSDLYIYCYNKLQYQEFLLEEEVRTWKK